MIIFGGRDGYVPKWGINWDSYIMVYSKQAKMKDLLTLYYVCSILHSTVDVAGQVLLDMPLPSSEDTPFIFSVTPVAIDLSEEAIFTMKGWNLGRTTTK